MKQLGTNMDTLEKKHYEQKIAQLESKMTKAQEDGERVTMDQLMLNVGLSPRLKDTIGKNIVFNTNDFSSPIAGGSAFQGALSSFKLRG